MNAYEVFLKKAGKGEFRHAGSLQAPDDEMALLLAAESYARRGEGSEMWLMNRSNILVGSPVALEVNGAKAHRHNDGSAVAARRRLDRDEQARGDA